MYQLGNKYKHAYIHGSATYLGELHEEYKSILCDFIFVQVLLKQNFVPKQLKGQGFDNKVLPTFNFEFHLVSLCGH